MTTQTQNLSELVAENVRALMARTKTKQSGLADVLHMTHTCSHGSACSRGGTADQRQNTPPPPTKGDGGVFVRIGGVNP